MILAAILLAALNTRSAYQFVDVSNIDVTGDYEAATDERVRGEHVARFYEWLGESRWMLEVCGGYVKSLHDLALPAPHEIATFDAAFAAYAATVASNSVNDVKFTRGSSFPGSYECFSATYSGESSSLTAGEIANAAWTKFCSTSSRPAKSDYSAFHQPYAWTMPTVASGDPIAATTINSMNKRNTDYSYAWYKIGANNAWEVWDNGYTAQRQFTRTYYHGSPFKYLKRGDATIGRDEPLAKYEDKYMDGNLIHDNIIKASGTYIDGQTFTIEYTASGTPTLRLVSGSHPQIAGRTGISIDNKSITLFFCCWKTGDSSMNVKVIAKDYDFYYESISDLADEVDAATTMPSGEYQTTYVSVLFAAHGIIYWDINANNFFD